MDEYLAAFPDKRCERVFAEGLETNPRKVKRAINVFLFISKLAEKRAIKLQSVRLAKIVVIYHSHSELYDLLRLNPALLRDLEVYLRQQLEPSEPGRVDREEVVASLTVRTSLLKPAKQPESPVPTRLLTDPLKRVLLLFPMDDDAGFAKVDYDELNSYFTLTRGTIAKMPVETAGEERTDWQAWYQALRGGEEQRKAFEVFVEKLYEQIRPVITLPFPVPTFVRVPAGEFLMGTSDEDIDQLLKMKETQKWAKEWKEKGYFKSEQPQHRVTLDEFQIAKYPVTNAQYQAFVQATKHQPPSQWSGGAFAEELAAHPVINVSWEDVAAYCEWLAQQLRAANQLRENEIIRLPTEAEWEKAASWDDEKKAKHFWPWGNIWDAAKCNTAESNIGTSTPVGKYSPAGDSFYGAADMAGNVWEWCADWYAEDYYKNSTDKNPTGAPSGHYRVLRGGSWHNDQQDARSADRFRNFPGLGYDLLGFRCARGSSS